MSFKTEKWPKDLRDDIGQAIADGQTAASVHRQLEAGTFKTWGEQPVPYQTVKYYGRMERKRRLSNTVSESVKGKPSAVIDRMAREILTEAEQELTKVRKAKCRDIDQLAKIAALIGKVRPLMADDKPEGEQKQGKPVDPLTAALTRDTAAKRARPKKPQEPQKEPEGSRPTARLSEARDDETDETTNGGVAAEALVSGVELGMGEEPAWLVQARAARERVGGAVCPE